MGLRWSMENILGWRSQFDRMERWHRRLQSLPGTQSSDQEALDFYLAFFQSCFALRDWLVEGGFVTETQIDGLVQGDPSMRICRDVCNRSKHFRLNRRPSVDADFSILREYRGEGHVNALAIIAGDEKRELWDVADSCVWFWRNLIRSEQIPEPPSPFAR
jgi:hypothetical protein